MLSHPPDIFLGRQPILDRQQRVLAYELLFRQSATASDACVVDDDRATAEVIKHAFSDLGIRTVVGRSRAFVNLGAETLMSHAIEELPQRQVVLEILETVDIDEQILQRCHELKAKGFQLALDDFVNYSEAYEPLLDIVDIVKVDVLQVAPGALADLVRRLRLRPTRLLAEKVDCLRSARECLALGFDLFQGFFFSRPAIIAA